MIRDRVMIKGIVFIQHTRQNGRLNYQVIRLETGIFQVIDRILTCLILIIQVIPEQSPHAVSSGCYGVFPMNMVICNSIEILCRNCLSFPDGSVREVNPR